MLQYFLGHPPSEWQDFLPLVLDFEDVSISLIVWGSFPSLLTRVFLLQIYLYRSSNPELFKGGYFSTPEGKKYGSAPLVGSSIGLFELPDARASLSTPSASPVEVRPTRKLPARSLLSVDEPRQFGDSASSSQPSPLSASVSLVSRFTGPPSLPPSSRFDTQLSLPVQSGVSSPGLQPSSPVVVSGGLAEPEEAPASSQGRSLRSSTRKSAPKATSSKSKGKAKAAASTSTPSAPAVSTASAPAAASDDTVPVPVQMPQKAPLESFSQHCFTALELPVSSCELLSLFNLIVMVF